FAHLGGFGIRPQDTPWFGAALRTPDQAREACDLAVRLSTRLLPLLAHQAARAAAETGLSAPRDYRGCVTQIRLHAAVAQTLTVLAPEVHAAAPARLAAAAGDGAGLGLRERRALRKQAVALVVAVPVPPREELALALNQAAAQLTLWTELRADDGLP